MFLLKNVMFACKMSEFILLPNLGLTRSDKK